MISGNILVISPVIMLFACNAQVFLSKTWLK